MNWRLSHRFDPQAVKIADRHYSRQKPGTPQFVPPGRNKVFVTVDGGAVWVTLWQYPEVTDHAWPGAWNNQFFHRDYGELASTLILEAIAATRSYWEPPIEGLITMIDPPKIRSTNPGYCYQMAGFRKVGKTQSGKLVFHLPTAEFPAAEKPVGYQERLTA